MDTNATAICVMLKRCLTIFTVYVLLTTCNIKILTAVVFIRRISTVIVFITDPTFSDAPAISALELVFTACYT